MPLRYKVLPDLGIIALRPKGVLTQACMMDYFCRVWSDPDWQPGLDRLIDNRDLTDIDMTYAQMRNIRAQEKPPASGQMRTRHAVFISPDDISYGMARMYRSIGAPSATEIVHIVDTLNEALCILRIDAAHAPRLNEI